MTAERTIDAARWQDQRDHRFRFYPGVFQR